MNSFGVVFRRHLGGQDRRDPADVLAPGNDVEVGPDVSDWRQLRACGDSAEKIAPFVIAFGVGETKQQSAIALAVEVDEQGARTIGGYERRNVRTGRCLPNPTFTVSDDVHVTKTRPVNRQLKFVPGR
jgi:hypothetical protein